MSVLSEDQMMGELYNRLEGVGWTLEPEPTLMGVVSDSKTFHHQVNQGSVKFLAQGEKVGVRFIIGAEPYFAMDHASPARVNAILDVLGILQTTGDWIAWYREGLWPPREEGSIPPS